MQCTLLAEAQSAAHIASEVMKSWLMSKLCYHSRKACSGTKLLFDRVTSSMLTMLAESFAFDFNG